MSTLAPARPGTMLRALLEAPGRVRMERSPIPKPGSTEILLRVDAALTCGTDVKTFRRGHPRIRLPAPFGHEFSGTIAAAGAAVTGFREGDAVACVPTAPCFECRPCRRGRTNLCGAAIERMVFGAFGEYVLLPQHLVRTNVYRRPDSLTAERAAMLEPLACVVHGADRIAVDAAADVLILGDGPIGILFAQLMHLRGNARVTVAGHHDTRLAVAASFGAQVTRAATDELVDLYSNRENAPDIVIECVGTRPTWEAAMSIVATGGVVLLYGGCAAGTEVPFDAYRIHYEEVDIRGAFHYRPEDVRSALSLLESGSVDVDPLITHRGPLRDFVEAFAHALDRSAIKVAILPGPSTTDTRGVDTVTP